MRYYYLLVFQRRKLKTRERSRTLPDRGQGSQTPKCLLVTMMLRVFKTLRKGMASQHCPVLALKNDLLFNSTSSSPGLLSRIAFTKYSIIQYTFVELSNFLLPFSNGNGKSSWKTGSLYLQARPGS